MAREAIIEKLNRALQEERFSEPLVVYVLVEIRKYLEQQKLLRKYPILNFFCCWAVHSKAKGGGADRILKRFDDAYPHFKKMTTQRLPEEIIEAIGRTIDLGKLRGDLTRFLNGVGLSPEICQDRPRWLYFAQAFSAVTEDCPFTLSASSTIRLTHVKHIIVKLDKAGARISGPRVVFRTVWKVIGPDDSELFKFSYQPLTRDDAPPDD
jgi:hypothetical protein